jgi:hypothetical protein
MFHLMENATLTLRIFHKISIRELPMRYVLPAVLLGAILTIANDARASTATVIPDPNGRSRGFLGAGGAHGLLGHFCGGSSKGLVSRGGTATVLANTHPCAQHRCAGYGPCFPNCFTGTPCPCCDHRILYPHPWSQEWKHAQQVAASGNSVAIRRPGLCARLFRKNHVD